MSRISTIYDKKVGKCFVVRGTEAYARTTDTILELVSKSNTDIYKFTATMTVNVLRDVGDSTIAIYDSDDLIKTIEWSDDFTTAQTFTVNLDYGTEHILTARYLGNKQCLKSHSKSVSVSQTRPPAYQSTISFGQSPDTVFLDDVTVPVTLTCSDQSVTSTKTLSILVDGETYGTLSVTPNTQTTKTFTDLDNGLHNIKFSYEGDEEITSCDNTITVSRGLDVTTFTNKTLFDGQTTGFYIEFSDYFGDTVDETVSYELSTQTTPHFETTLEDGSIETETAQYLPVTISFTDDTQSEQNKIIGTLLSDNDKTIGSFSWNINLVRLTDLTLTPAKPYLQDNATTTITGKLTTTGSAEGIPVTVGSNNYITDENGEFTYSFTMYSQYDVQTVASVGSITATKTIENVLQYWDSQNPSWEVNVSSNNYELNNVRLEKLWAGYKIEAQSSSSQGYFRWKASVTDDVYIDFDIPHQGNSSRNKFMNNYTMSSVSNGSHFRCMKRTSSFGHRIWVNNVLKSTFTSAPTQNFSAWVGIGGSSSMTFNKLKIKRVQGD